AEGIGHGILRDERTWTHVLRGLVGDVVDLNVRGARPIHRQRAVQHIGAVKVGWKGWDSVSVDGLAGGIDVKPVYVLVGRDGAKAVIVSTGVRISCVFMCQRKSVSYAAEISSVDVDGIAVEMNGRDEGNLRLLLGKQELLFVDL